jgi:membrane protein implicated in regulation of membrane protease activity
MIETLEILHASCWFWIGMALFLAIVEILGGGNFFLLWIALSSLLVGCLKFLMSSLIWQHQWLIFSLISLISVVLWNQYLKHRPIKATNLNQGAEKFIGKNFILVESISQGIGKVRIADSVWKVEGPELKAGTTVQVVAIDGIILRVKETTSN